MRKLFFISLLLFAFTIVKAQTLDPKKNDALKRSDLPKLDKVQLGTPSGAIIQPYVQEDGPYLSEAETQGRSTSDGKISKFEQALIEKSKRMPQVE